MAKDVKRAGVTKYKGADGKEYTLNLNNYGLNKEDDAWSNIKRWGGQAALNTATVGTYNIFKGDGYRTNNLFRRGNMDQLSASIEQMLAQGSIPTKEQLADNGIVLNDAEYANISHDLAYFLETNDISLDQYRKDAGLSNDISEQEAAFNNYYRYIYSLDEGTGGREIYDSLVQAEQNAALSNMQLADANLQQQAMQQAQTVKSITDQVRAERISRLRAGMSESQIANQDMATLMSNVNALNQQVADANAARLQAQQQYQNAQDTAYQAWLANANTMAQSGAAYAASDAGDIIQQARKYAQATGIPLSTAIDKLSGKQTS